MQADSPSLKQQIALIEWLFENKQLDDFVSRVETNIIPYLNRQEHLVSEHMIEKEQELVIAQQAKDHSKKVKTKEQIGIEKLHLQQPSKNDPNPPQAIQPHNQSTHLQLLKHQISTKPHHPTSHQLSNALKHAKINILQKYQQMKLVLFKIQRQMQKLSTPMNDKSEWKVNKINPTSTIGVKTKGTMIEIRYQGVVETNIFNLCVMIYLSELWKEWVPFCTGSKTIAEPSPLEKVVLIDLKIPFLTQRYSYLHGVAIDRITKNGKLYIYAQGITHQKDLLINVHKTDPKQYQKKVSKSVVLDAKYMMAQIGNEGNGKYSVKVYGMLDSHMPLLPEKIVNYIVKQLGGMIFEKIVDRAKDIKGTAWEKELKENEKRENKNMFYGWLDERIKNWDKTQNVRKSKM